MRIIALMLLTLTACGGGGAGPTAPPIDPPAKLVASGAVNMAMLGGESGTPSVVVSNAAGKGLAGVTVTFTATGGVLATSSAVTDASGTASVRWTPESISSVQTMTASVAGTQLSTIFYATVTTSIAGNWSGAGGAGYSATMSISHHVSATATATVDGNATLRLTPGTGIATSVGGSANGDAFAIQFRWAQAGVPIAVTFAGKVEGKDTRLVGALSGAGLVDVPFTMTKVQ